jgi:peroxiredoxin
MHNISRFFFIIIVVFMMASAGQALELGQAAPDFTLPDTEGKTHKLADLRGKFVVLEWINYDCPFVVKHYKSGNMQSLQKKYTEQDVVWFSVCSSAPGKQGHFPIDKIKSMKKEKEAAYSAYLIDASGDVGRAYDAKTTPHMYIINPEGILIYAGGIDDKPSTDLKDIKTANNYVSTMMDDALAGKEVQPLSTKPYGCSVKY